MASYHRLRERHATGIKPTGVAHAASSAESAILRSAQASSDCPCNGSGKNLERERRCQRVEVAAIGRRNARQAEALGQRDDGGIDEPEIDVGKSSVQIRNAGVRVLRQVC
jgi:hypothetical protein